MFSDCVRQRISDASFLIQPHIAPFAPVFSVFIQVTRLNAEWIQRFQPLLTCAAIKIRRLFSGAGRRKGRLPVLQGASELSEQERIQRVKKPFCAHSSRTSCYG